MKLYSWGANSYGQLSHGVVSEQCLFPSEAVLTCSLENVVSLAAGGGHTLVLDSAGNLLGSGSNSHGQLGDCQNSTSVLSKVLALQEFRLAQIECGWESSYAITDGGCVVAWGSNKCGQLGTTKEKVTTTKHPVILETPPVVQVSAGLRHTAMVTSDGHVLVCGRGNKGQLGVMSSAGSFPTKDVDSLVKVEGLENVSQVACGQHHTLALTTDGNLYGWGDNKRGQLGEGPSSSPTPRLLMSLEPGATVRAGWTHSAVLSGGKVITWGRNSYSQLGHSSGQEYVYKPNELAGLSGVKQLELGSEHNLALLYNGEVWSWGWNEHGNCGTGVSDNVAVPQQVGVSTSTLISTGGGHSLALSL